MRPSASAVRQKHSLKTELDELESETDAPSLRSKKPERQTGEGRETGVSPYYDKIFPTDTVAFDSNVLLSCGGT